MSLRLPGHEELPSLETPLEMLLACHGRVRKFCHVIQQLVTHLPQHGLTVDARQAAGNVIRYFDLAAPRHHADEEEDLFPALLLAAGEQVEFAAMRAALLALRHEHEPLGLLWQQLRPRLQAIHDGHWLELNEGELASRFAADYMAHAAREEAEVYPAAAQLLSTDVLARIAEQMVARRRH